MDMISRRKIISRSQSELDYNPHALYEIEEDVWFSQDKLYQDHITEILRKWDQIDDEIWGKIICMERNRRIAKAYSRVPVLTISGSEDGFDGYKIGLNGFDNPMRDALTKTVKSHIGKGVRLKMDDMGNIIIKRMSNCDVFIRGWDRESNSLSKEIVELSGELEFERSVKLFDMRKFQSNVARELRSSYPDRKKLESQCICAIAFVKDTSDLLDLCSWVLLINIVALDLLKSRFPAILQNREATSNNTNYTNAPKFVSIFDEDAASDEVAEDITPRSRDARRRIISDEDPYSLPREVLAKNGKSGRILMPSVTGNSSSGDNSTSSSSEPKPPELPPRDFAKNKKSKITGGRHVLPQAIRSLVGNNKSTDKNNSKSRSPPDSSSPSAEDKRRQEIEYEDPYYCGLQARVPNFGGRNRKSIASVVPSSSSVVTASREYYNPNPSNGYHGYHQYNQYRDVIPAGLNRYNHRSSSQHPFSMSSQMEIRKSQSNGYLNSLFNTSSNSFFPSSSKKLDNKGSSFNSNPYYDSSLESDAYGISSGSGYDIYAPLTTTPLYGRLRAQLGHTNTAGKDSKTTGNGSSNKNNVKNGVVNGNHHVNGSGANGSGGNGSGGNASKIITGKNNSKVNASVGEKTASSTGVTNTNSNVNSNNNRKNTSVHPFHLSPSERYASEWD